MKHPLTITDLMTERGPNGVARQCDDYLRAEGIMFVCLDRHEQLAAKHLGFSLQDKGVCDRIVFVPHGRPWRHVGDVQLFLSTITDAKSGIRYGTCAGAVAIEYKRPNRGRISAAQKAFARECAEIGLPHAYITGLDELKLLIPPKSEWMKR